MRRSLPVALLCLMSATAAAEENVMLVLDASGSMWGQIDGKAKIEIAREAVDQLASQWKPENRLGLLAYGHRRKGDCTDIETLYEPQTLNPKALRDQVQALNPKGMTPLSAAVIQAAQVLRSSEQKATVILISDGEETCNLDPCAVGKELEKNGVDFTAHVIGFDVSNPAHQAQLRCLAENTGGQYFNARDAKGLSGSLTAAVAVSTEARLPPARASISAPDRAPIVTTISVTFEGPGDEGDFIGIYPADAADAGELDYAWIKDANPAGTVELAMPAEQGRYELRYVSPLREPKVLERRPIEATPSAVSISGPAQAVAGSTIEIQASGPVSDSHWIGFAPVGTAAGAYLQYERPQPDVSRYSLRTPALAGDYELRYVLNESESVAARQVIRILPAQASIEAPLEVKVGEMVKIRARGPVAQGNWIGFAPAGSEPGAYLAYDDIRGEDESYEIRAPEQPGDYELRFMAYTNDTALATRSIKVVP
ncbi:MAG: VWA domain-containing protein [Lysobacterales bacterium]